MDHEGKVGVAESIGREVAQRFRDRILVGLLSGSVARGEDTEHSDLEVVFVTKEKLRLPGMSPDGFREFLLGDLQTQIEFRTKEEVLENLTHVGPYWPFRVWFYLEPHIFCGDSETVQSTLSEFRQRVASLPDAVFRKAAGHALLWVRGHFGKVMNAAEEGDDARAAQAAEWMGYEVAGFVALVNQKYYRRADLRHLKESASFSHLPESYRSLMLALHESRGYETTLRVATQVYEACEALARQLGIALDRLENVSDL